MGFQYIYIYIYIKHVILIRKKGKKEKDKKDAFSTHYNLNGLSLAGVIQLVGDC